MTIDHIGEYFPVFPLWFRWLGRLSAPLFFFMATEGIVKTKDAKKSLSRLYLGGNILTFASYILPEIFGKFGYAFDYPRYNIFTSIFHGTFVIYILEIKKRDRKKGEKYLIMYICCQIIHFIWLYLWGNCISSALSSFNLHLFPIIYDLPTHILPSILGSVWSASGSIYLIYMTVLFYYCNNNKMQLAIGYSLYCLIYFLLWTTELPIILRPYIITNQLTADFYDGIFCFLGVPTIWKSDSFTISLLTQNCQWMMIFALPIMLMYNGEKGKGYKPLFYIYYPLHLFIIKLVQCIL